MSDLLEANALLLVLADEVNDLERLRIATQGRLRALGDEKGLPADSPVVVRMGETLEALTGMENAAVKDLERAMKAHPLGAFVKGTVGLGLKQTARLLAAIGDPGDRENPAKLWQYCGHGDPLRSKRRRGEVCSHSPEAKMRVHLIAESCIKQMHSPYRRVYDDARAAWADRDTTDGHKHNHALRIVGKAILLDLWRYAKHGATDRTEELVAA